MAQYFWTAEDYALNATPSDAWAIQRYVSSYQIKSGANGQYMEVIADVGQNIGSRLHFLPPVDAANAQIYAKFAVPSGDSNSEDISVVTRADATWANKVRADVSVQGTFLRLAERVAGAFTVLDLITDATITPAFDQTGYILSDVTEGIISARYWNDNDNEPSTYLHEATVQVQTPGRFGIAFWAGNRADPYQRRVYVYEFGVGTDGDPAPRSALATPTATPFLIYGVPAVAVTAVEGVATRQSHRADAGATTKATGVAAGATRQGHRADAGAVAKQDALTGLATRQSHQADAGALAQTAGLNAQDTRQGHRADAGAVAQAAGIEAQNTRQAHQANAGTVAQAAALDAVNTRQSHRADAGAVVKADAVNAVETRQAHRADAGAVAQAAEVAGVATRQAHRADAGTAVKQDALAGQATRHAHRSSMGAVAQQGIDGIPVRQSHRADAGVASAETFAAVGGVNTIHAHRADAGAAGRLLAQADIAALAATVLSALEWTAIPVNLVKVRGQSVIGTGATDDPWGPGADPAPPGDWASPCLGGGTLTCADIDAVAAAVQAALEQTAIPVDLVKVKGQAINGAGSATDPWGP